MILKWMIPRRDVTLYNCCLAKKDIKATNKFIKRRHYPNLESVGIDVYYVVKKLKFSYRNTDPLHSYREFMNTKFLIFDILNGSFR